MATDPRVERAQRLAAHARRLSVASPRRRRLPMVGAFARPVPRRVHAANVRELVDASGHDRNALLRAADLAAAAGDEVAEAMLRDAVAVVTSR